MKPKGCLDIAADVLNTRGTTVLHGDIAGKRGNGMYSRINTNTNHQFGSL